MKSLEGVPMDRKQFRKLLIAAVLSAFAGGALTGLVLNAQVAFGQLREKVIRAESFQIVDGEGRVVSEFGTGSDGSTRIGFWDKNGLYRAGFGIFENGDGAITFYDDEGNAVSEYGIAPDGIVRMGFWDKAGSFRAGLGMYVNGDGALTFYDRSGRPVTEYGVNPEGEVLISFWSEEGISRAVFGVYGENDTALTFYDRGKGRYRVRYRA